MREIINNMKIEEYINNYNIYQNEEELPNIKKQLTDEQKKRNKNKYFKIKYNITLLEYDKMVEEQENKCAICHLVKPLYIDHNHKTGQIRKLLCNNCNTLIGFANEDTQILNDAITYLRQEYDI